MAIFELRNVRKRFGAVEALQGVSFRVDAGEVVGMMGDNGAGKSTLMKTIAGVNRPDEGEVFLRGEQVSFKSLRDAAAGIATVYQDLALVNQRSVAENVFLGRGTILVRADSEIDVPEPELALVLNAAGEIVGYTICDDVSSRSVEGENPLYLPQAKAYAAACAVASWFVPASLVPNVTELTIQLIIERGGEPVWSGRTSTSLLHRTLDDLAGYLFRENVFPDGAVLSTGTCLVPDLPFTLEVNDIVRVGIESLGELRNHVQRGLGAGIVEVARDTADR